MIARPVRIDVHHHRVYLIDANGWRLTEVEPGGRYVLEQRNRVWASLADKVEIAQEIARSLNA